MTLIQFKVKTPKVMFPHLEIHVRFKCLNPYHDLQIKDQQHLTVIREKFSWPATKNLVLRLDPTQWVQENMGVADSDKKLIPAYIIPPGTRTSQPYKCNSNYHSWENTKCPLCLFLTDKSAVTGTEKIHNLCCRHLKSWQYSQKTRVLWAETALYDHMCHGAEGLKGCSWGKRLCTGLKASPYLK